MGEPDPFSMNPMVALNEPDNWVLAHEYHKLDRTLPLGGDTFHDKIDRVNDRYRYRRNLPDSMGRVSSVHSNLETKADLESLQHPEVYKMKDSAVTITYKHNQKTPTFGSHTFYGGNYTNFNVADESNIMFQTQLPDRSHPKYEEMLDNALLIDSKAIPLQSKIPVQLNFRDQEAVDTVGEDLYQLFQNSRRMMSVKNEKSGLQATTQNAQTNYFGSNKHPSRAYELVRNPAKRDEKRKREDEDGVDRKKR
jgi:hypothetical protein